MSRSSKRRTRQAKRTAVSQIKRDLQENAPSAIPRRLVAQITQEVTTEYRGPYPPPGLLAEYNEVLPGCAERIIAMAENQIAHRIDLERTVIKGDSRRSWWGLVLGFLSTLVIAGVGLTVALKSSPAAGATIITGTIVSLSGVFVYGQWSRRSEREHKANLMAGRR